MANENKKINELVSEDDEPTAELDVTELRTAAADDDDTVNTQALSELQLDADERSETISRLQSDIEQLHSKWLGLETEISAREEVVNNLEKEVDELRSDVARKRKLLKKRDKTIKKLRSENSNRRREHEQLVEKHAVTWQQVAEQTTAAAEHEKQLKNATRELDAAHSELDSRSEEIASLEAQLKARGEAHASLEQQLATLTSELVEVRSLDAGHVADLEGAEAQLEAMQADLKARDQAHASLEQRHKALTGDLEELRALDADHTAALDKANAEIQTMRDDLETAGAKIFTLEAKIAEDAATKRLLDEQRAELQRQVEEQGLAIAEKEAALEAVENELEQTSLELKTVLDQGPPDIVLADISRSEAQEIQAQIARTEQYADTLRYKLRDLDRSHAELVDERERLSESLELVATENVRLSKEISEANALIVELQTGIEVQQKEQQAALQKFQTDHEQELHNLRFELSDAKDRVTETTKVKEQLAAELQQAREIKNDLEGMLSQNDEQAKRRIEELEKQIKRLTQSTADFEHQLKTKGAAITALRRQLARKSEQLDSIGEIEQVIQDIDDRMSGRLDDESAQDADIAVASDNRERVSRVMIGNIGGQVLRFPLFKDRLTIGRTSENDIQVKTAYVSRRHAVVLTKDDGVHIVDSGSSNGLFVNSRRVKKRRLSHGDIVTVGDSKFRYEEHQRRETA
jgi:chromosome segregation ATPase